MANWAKECRLCRYAGGRRIPGYKKVHVRTDPACRLHEATTKDNVYAKVRQQKQRDPSRSRGEATTPPPGGMVLHDQTSTIWCASSPRKAWASCSTRAAGQVDRTRGTLRRGDGAFLGNAGGVLQRRDDQVLHGLPGETAKKARLGASRRQAGENHRQVPPQGYR